MKLTETMLHGLAQMARYSDRRGNPVMAEPNENTGKALMKRGLIELTGSNGGVNLYDITEAGRQALKGGQ